MTISRDMFETGEVLTAAVMNEIVDELLTLKDGVGLAAYKVGDLKLSTSNVNPGNTIGGTWQLYAQGKALIGVDPNDNDFSNGGNTGGSKDLAVHSHSTPNHTHSITIDQVANHTHGLTYSKDAAKGTAKNRATATGGGGAHSHSTTQVSSGAGVTGNSGATQSGKGNMPPYITVYVFKRTA